VFEQVWIGTEDKLPRRARAVFVDDPLQLRQEIEFSNWRLDSKVPANAFSSSPAKNARRIPFERPDFKASPPEPPATSGAK